MSFTTFSVVTAPAPRRASIVISKVTALGEASRSGHDCRVHDAMVTGGQVKPHHRDPVTTAPAAVYAQARWSQTLVSGARLAAVWPRQQIQRLPGALERHKDPSE